MNCVQLDTILYLDQNSIPGGTNRNWKSYGQKVTELPKNDWAVLADPQTSGGLLVSVDNGSESEFEQHCMNLRVEIKPFGKMVKSQDPVVSVR